MKNKARTPKTEPAQTTKSSGIWKLAKGRHDTTMSNAVMDTHSMIFVSIGNLVSPSSSVNGDPLSDFPDHWQPRFSAQFSLRRTGEGANRLAPSKRKIFPVSAARESRAVKPRGLLSRSYHLRDKMFTY